MYIVIQKKYIYTCFLSLVYYNLHTHWLAYWYPTTLQLPVELKLILSQVNKKQLAQKHMLKIKEVARSLKEALSRVTTKTGMKCVRHTEKLQEPNIVKQD